MAELPIIALAFANEQEGRRYLRDLPEVLRQLQGILKGAERNALCRLELLPNASLDQIFDVFTRNRDQITILHYAGHADSGRLLLESSAAGGAPAHAAGLATYLGQCGGLQLVFLNGCSTRAQVARLLEAGVAAVIATARAIDDGMARAFAVAFYTELASGLPLRAAYEKAKGRVLAAHDTVPEAYYGHRDLGTTSESASPDPTDDHGFPWEFRPGTDLVERWSLPDAAGYPEFGLPHPPERDLPETPFRHLNWFTAEHAEVFFGRGYQVRELYEQVSDPTGPPILLLYGASGVGKSSLLDAGLVPRLEAAGHVVRYRRRDQQKGLLGSLRDALQLAGEPTALAEGWRAQEPRPDRSLVVFLDQVEEVFTRPDPAQPRELDEFLVTVGAALGNRDARPRGKLVLGFRKEWLAEIDRRLAEAKLPRAKVFLKQLDRRGIVEAIRGPARPGRLQRQYRLAIEDGLPEVIADNLLADAGSALAPTLQVLLTKMWERARQSNPDQPRFDRALYESLKSEGYLLKDVLDEGLKAIGRWNPAVEKSGLALDVLAYHTTDLGTASQRTSAELTARYARQVDSLDGLLGQCKDHYLIVEAEPYSGSTTRSTRLAHDLLAPLVQQRFRLSVAPGQRARRLLENRAPEWQDDKIGSVLDSTDLATVDEGASGMRIWTADETRLVEASRRAEEQEKAQEQERARRLREAEERQRQAEADKRKETEQRLKEQEESNLRLRKRAYALGAILAVTVGVALLAAYQWRAARNQTWRAEQNLRIATSRQFAAFSASERNKRLDRSLLLAVEALRADNTFEARDSLYNALQARPGLATFLHSDEGKVTGVTLTADGRVVAAGFTGVDSGVVLWDVAARKRLPDMPLKVGEGRETASSLSGDGKIVAAAYTENTRFGVGGVVLWDVAARKRLPDMPLKVGEGQVMSVSLSADGRTLAAGADASLSGSGGIVLWDVAACKRLVEAPLVMGEGAVAGVALSGDGRTLAAAYTPRNDGAAVSGVVLWDVAARKRLVEAPLVMGEGAVAGVALSGDGRTLAVGYGGDDFDVVALWDVTASNRLAEAPLPVREGQLGDVALSGDGKTLATGYNNRGEGGGGGVVLWDAPGRKRLSEAPLAVHEGSVGDVAFSGDGKIVAAGYAVPDVLPNVLPFGSNWQNVRDVGSGIVLWDVSAIERLPDMPLMVGKGKVVGIALSGDGRILAAGYAPRGDEVDSGIALWDVATRKRLVDMPLRVDEGAVTGVTLSGDGKTLAAAYSRRYGHLAIRSVLLWDVATRERLPDMPLAAGVEGVAFSAEIGVALSADGRTLAAGYASLSDGGSSSRIVLWDVAARKRLVEAPLVVGQGVVTGVALSGDGKTLAAAYMFLGVGGVVLWDVAARERLVEAPLVAGQGVVTGVALSGDGKTLAAGYLNDRGAAAGAVLWDLDLKAWVRHAGRVANRNLTRDEWRQYFGDETYHRTFRQNAWPSDMPETERKLAEQKEQELPSSEEVSTR